VSNIDSNYIVCNEAISMFLPIIGVIDSNSKSFLVKFPIVSNDDSMESFYFIFNIISKLILLFKYKKLILWFFKYKKAIKEVNFKRLINYLYYIKKCNFKSTFSPLNLFNELNKNIKSVEYFYKNITNIKFFNKKSIINFDSIFFKKKFYYKKFSKLVKYKYNFGFNNKLGVYISTNIRKALYTLRRRKKINKYVIKKYKNIIKYFQLY
jgi:hypothetical protein